MKTKIMSMILAATMCISMAVPSFAHMDANEQFFPVQSRAALCPDCERGHMRSFTEYGAWDTVGYCLCVEGDPTHTDKVMERDVTKGYRCSYCGVTFKETSTETKYVCQYV